MGNRWKMEENGGASEIRKELSRMMIHILCRQAFHQSFTSAKETFEGTYLCSWEGESYQFDAEEGRQLAYVANSIIAEWDCEDPVEVVVLEFEEGWMIDAREYENNSELSIQCFLRFQRCK